MSTYCMPGTVESCYLSAVLIKEVKLLRSVEDDF